MSHVTGRPCLPEFRDLWSLTPSARIWTEKFFRSRKRTHNASGHGEREKEKKNRTTAGKNVKVQI
jgi:hypothetical protein